MSISVIYLSIWILTDSCNCYARDIHVYIFSKWNLVTWNEIHINSPRAKIALSKIKVNYNLYVHKYSLSCHQRFRTIIFNGVLDLHGMYFFSSIFIYNKFAIKKKNVLWIIFFYVLILLFFIIDIFVIKKKLVFRMQEITIKRIEHTHILN
jgi:hypothetical protein